MLIYRKIYKKIKKYNTIVIARHVGPDPDSLGAQIALREIIKSTFPKKKVLAVGTPTSKFKFIGDLDKMDDNYYNDSLLIVVDVPDKSRVDGVDINRFNNIIKIDHHPFMELFSNLEWIDDTASSVCQMIIELCFNTRLKLSSYAAERLFVGLVADTNRFLYCYTTVKTFDLVKKLIKKTKIDIISLYKQLYIRPMSEVRLQGYIAQNMIVTENGLGYIIIKNEVIKELKVDAASAGNIINGFNYIEEVLVWMMVSEDIKQNKIRVNIRSRGPEINTIAEQYNGGGHKYASGARVSTYKEVETIVEKLDKVCKEYQNSIER